ncbi:MAG: hypothetical protein WCA46_19355 [Actinocatenispora sp.]
MTRLVARTVREAYIYLEATLPGQEIVDFERDSRLDRTDHGGYVLRFDGVVDGGRVRVDVEIPRDDETDDEIGVRSYGPGRSTLLDAGQWFYVEVARVNVAVADLAALGGAAATDPVFNGIVRAWEAAAGAVDEIAKFLPEGAGSVPADAFWTDAGRRALELQPDVFQRERIVRSQRRYRQEITEFTARQG